MSLFNFNNFPQHPRTFLIIFLIFCVCSSKNIIIYNEETLVALSFLLFVLFVFHYFGSTLSESLDERSEGIRKECQNFLHYKEESLQELCQQHKKIAQLQGNLSQLMVFTKSTAAQLTATGKNALEKTFSQQIVQKCSELRASQLPQALQTFMAKNQEQLVLIRCAKQGLNQLPAFVLKNAIQLVKSTAKEK